MDYIKEEVIEKYKKGIEYTAGKVKILRPVNQGGFTFQRNYWVDINDVQPKDVIVSGDAKTKGSVETETIQNYFFGTESQKIYLTTTVQSVQENAKNFIKEILDELKEIALQEMSQIPTSDTIKKLGLIRSTLKNAKNNEAEQLLIIQDQLWADLNIFFDNTYKVNKIVSKIKDKLLTLHAKGKIIYPIDVFIPNWLDTIVELKDTIKVNYPKYNFTYNRLDYNNIIFPENYNNALGYKIELEERINKLTFSYLKNKEEQFTDILFTNYKGVNVNNIIPFFSYSNTNSNALLFFDPIISQKYSDVKNTNILSSGLQYFMKDSAFEKLMIFDYEYAQLLIGILISNKGE
jgi:hypothetical protein